MTPPQLPDDGPIGDDLALEIVAYNAETLPMTDGKDGFGMSLEELTARMSETTRFSRVSIQAALDEAGPYSKRHRLSDDQQQHLLEAAAGLASDYDMTLPAAMRRIVRSPTDELTIPERLF